LCICIENRSSSNLPCFPPDSHQSHNAVYCTITANHNKYIIRKRSNASHFSKTPLLNLVYISSTYSIALQNHTSGINNEKDHRRSGLTNLTPPKLETNADTCIRSLQRKQMLVSSAQTGLSANVDIVAISRTLKKKRTRAKQCTLYSIVCKQCRCEGAKITDRIVMCHTTSFNTDCYQFI